MILIQTCTDGSHTISWAHSLTDFWMFLIYRKQIAENSVHICTLCSKFPISWGGTQRRPRMALIFTFPHLDSTGKGRTPGSYSSSASTVVEIKRGVLLSGAPAGGEFLGRQVCFDGPGGTRDGAGRPLWRGQRRGRWKCPPARDWRQNTALHVSAAHRGWVTGL